MATVVVLVGQCGNQIGVEFWDILGSTDYFKNPAFFRESGKAHCILVDSEPKVLQQYTTTQESTIWNPNNIIWRQSGRGNNWAFGYQDIRFRHQYSLAEKVQECLRREIEACDSFGSCIVFHSLAGGTGSGLGSRIVEQFREDYGERNALVSAAILPYEAGETPLQNYNSLLSLAWLQEYVNAAILFPNEAVLETMMRAHRWLRSLGATGSLGKHRVTKSVSVPLSDMNKYIAGSVVGQLLPYTLRQEEEEEEEHRFDVRELIGAILPKYPRHKFLECRYAPLLPFVSANSQICLEDSWETVVDQLPLLWPPHNSTFIGRYGNTTSTFVAEAARVVVRGIRHEDELEKVGLNSALQRYLGLTIKPAVIATRTPLFSQSSVRSQKSINVAFSGKVLAHNLRRIVDRARLKYEAKAYLHWYSKYGCDEDVFASAFEVLEDSLGEDSVDEESRGNDTAHTATRGRKLAKPVQPASPIAVPRHVMERQRHASLRAGEQQHTLSRTSISSFRSTSTRLSMHAPAGVWELGIRNPLRK